MTFRKESDLLGDDRKKLIQELEAQIDFNKKLKEDIKEQGQVYLRQREEKKKLEDDLTSMESNHVLQLQKLFDKIDPETSCALPSPSSDQLLQLILKSKVGPADL
jgi:hypothetical protein